LLSLNVQYQRDRRVRDCRVVGFTTACVISAYHHWSCEFEPRSWLSTRYNIMW